MAEIYDLDNLKPKESEFVDIKHPKTGTSVGLRIEVWGKTSAQYKKARHKLRNRRLNSKVPVSSQLIDAEAIELLAACTKGWEGQVRVKKKLLEYNPENAKLVYETYPTIKDQVDTFLGEESNFLPESGEN